MEPKLYSQTLPDNVVKFPATTLPGQEKINSTLKASRFHRKLFGHLKGLVDFVEHLRTMPPEDQLSTLKKAQLHDIHELLEEVRVYRS